VAIYDTVNPIGEYKAFYLELAAKLAGERGVLSIIDLGCGSGQLTCELAKQGHHLIGVEPSEAMLQLARQRAANELVEPSDVMLGLARKRATNELVEPLVADVKPLTADVKPLVADSTCDLPSRSISPVEWLHGGAQNLGAFEADLAVMTGHVAQFFLEDESWQQALRSIHGALKPGGHLAFECRNPLVQPFLKASRQVAQRESQVSLRISEHAECPEDAEYSEHSKHTEYSENTKHSKHTEYSENTKHTKHSKHSEHAEYAEHIDWPSDTNRRKVFDPLAGAVEWWFHLLSVEGERVLYEIHYLFESTGEKAISVNELRFRSREELQKSLADAGFTVECVYGNWDFQLADVDSPEFIFLARS
jgi:SAM-dependent methyltransferase